MTLPDRLLKIQEYSKLSVRALALSCGLKQQTLDKHIKGLSEPSAATLTGILSHYPEISADWLLLGKGEMLRKPLVTDIDRITALVDTIADLKVAISEKDKTIAILTAEVEKFKLKAP